MVVLTDGYPISGKDSNEADIVQKRKSELKKAMAFVNILNYKNLMIPDGKVKFNLNKLNSLNIQKYDYVFIPNDKENHCDHAYIYKKVKQLLRFSYKTRIICYEVWSPIPRPNLYLDISDIKDKKAELISNYDSQIKNVDYVNSSLALNLYRGFQIKIDHPEITYAEAYIEKFTFIKRLFSVCVCGDGGGGKNINHKLIWN